MDDKIEVNEYVRTRAGHIYKITNIDENGLIYWNKIQCGWSEQQLEDIIVKHSKIISEVVEIGDYVNGKLIHKIDKGPNYCYLYYGNCKTFVDYQIKTILTKEQMEANCYKVGGKDDGKRTNNK